MAAKDAASPKGTVSLPLILRCDEKSQKFIVSGVSRESHAFLGSRDLSLTFSELAVVARLLEMGSLQDMMETHEFVKQVNVELGTPDRGERELAMERPAVEEEEEEEEKEKGAQRTLERGSKSSVEEYAASVDAPLYRFQAYEEGSVVELNIGRLETQSFTIMAVVCLSRYAYSMIASKDRCGVAEDQFRWELQPSGHMAVAGLGISSGCPGPRADARDPNGWSSELTSNIKLPLNRPVAVALVRDADHLELFMDGRSVSYVQVDAQEEGRHENILPLRIGSRFPPYGGDSPHDPFPGSINSASFVFAAIPKEVLAKFRA